MTTLPELRTSFGEEIGVELFMRFPDLRYEEKTYLDADAASGVTTLTANGLNFSVGQFIVLGFPGNEKTEIVQLHASTPPTATTITLAAATSFAHNRGDIIRFIPFNQITPERSTDSGSNFSALTAVNIRPDATETYVQRTGDASTDVYRYRFSNSSTSLYSQYSSQVVASGLTDGTAGAVIYRALDQLGEEIGDLISKKFLFDSLLEARRTLDQNPAVFRWSFRTKMNQVLGQMLAGSWQITAPTDLRDRNSFKNILSLRFGNQNRPVGYQDRRRFNQNYLNVRRTTVATQAAIGATSLVLTSTHDLDSAGTIRIANGSYSDGLIAITYTGNNRATNTLTGIPASSTGSITRIVTAGTTIWQNATFGLFSNYTIDNATISFDVPLSTQYDGQDLKGDYYMSIPAMTQDSDTFDEPFYDLYVAFLKWKIKYKKSNGKLTKDKDSDWNDWISGVATLLGQEVGGQWVNFVPDANGFLQGDG